MLVDEDQVSLAIGKGGQNIRLASKLSGYDLQLVKESSEYDIDLEEFQDEIGAELFAKFIENGYSTAKEVIDASPAELARMLELPQEKVDEIVALIKTEFEEAEEDDDDESQEQQEEEESRQPS